MKKNVLIVGDSIYPDNMGGSHRHMYDLAIQLKKKGFEVFVITSNKGGILKNKENINGINYFRYFRNSENKIKGLLDFIIGPYKVYKNFAKCGIMFDVIHGHWPLTNFLIFKFSKKINKVYTFHGPAYKEFELEYKNKKIFLLKLMLKLLKYIERKVLCKSDEIIVASEYMKTQILENFNIENYINIIPVPTDVNRFRPKYKDKQLARNDLNLCKSKIYLLSVRRLQKRMGLDNLIKAMSLVCKYNKDINLLIGGKGPFKTELINLSKKYGINDKIEFLGFISEDKLNIYYEASDLLIMPSLDLEGFGLTTTEAMACGTEVIGTPIGGNKEILNLYNNKYITKTVKYEDIAEKIIEILSDIKEVKYNENARNFVIKNYSWEVLIDKIIDVYRR